MGLAESYGEEMFDRIEARVVEFTTDETGKCWLNIDGRCIARVGFVEQIIIDGPGDGTGYRQVFDFKKT